MSRSAQFIDMASDRLAHNYDPIPIVISSGKGVWYQDVDGDRYLDMLAGYSAANFGHGHEGIIRAIINQASRVLVVPRAFLSDRLCEFAPALAEFCGKDKVLPMNGGVEGFETALKMVRRWGYYYKGIHEDMAEVVVCGGNFHGRTLAAISASDNPEARNGFGPFLTNIVKIPFGDPDSLGRSINKNTAAFIVEPIQGEGGINIPPDGYLKEVVFICKKYNVLSVFDEIQTGFGRTGYDLAWHYEGAEPDILIIGKSLGSGIAVSAVAANDNIMNFITPGSHGSTYGGNPLACAVAVEAINILRDEKLSDKSAIMGKYFMTRLRDLKSPLITEVRGRGLMIGVEFISDKFAKLFKKAIFHEKILCKETRDNVIRFSPPLVITTKEIDWSMLRIERVLREMQKDLEGGTHNERH